MQLVLGMMGDQARFLVIQEPYKDTQDDATRKFVKIGGPASGQSYATQPQPCPQPVESDNKVKQLADETSGPYPQQNYPMRCLTLDSH